MHEFAVILMISGTILIGAMSPGPSFLIVARTAIARSRGYGVLAALGMGLGGALFALAALLGLQLVLKAAPSIYIILRIGGAAYLLFLAYRLWQSAPQPLEIASSLTVHSGSAFGAFLLGLSTQLSNPKTAIVYTSIFSAALRGEPSWTIITALVPIVFMIESGWYVLVAVAFSTGKARRVYARWKMRIDRLAAGVMSALGVKILAEVRVN